MATLEASPTLGRGSAITPSLAMLAAEPAEVQEGTPGEAEADIQRALFVGNYPQAVDVCLKVKRLWERVGACRAGKTTLPNGFAFLALACQPPGMQVGRHADALLIASLVGGEVWERARSEFMRSQPRPYMRVVQAVVTSDWKGGFCWGVKEGKFCAQPGPSCRPAALPRHTVDPLLSTPHLAACSAGALPSTACLAGDAGAAAYVCPV
jgi:hypothetical protein